MSFRSPSAPAGEVIVVTGASAGIGRATACAFANRGTRIALLARGIRGLADAQREVAARGAQVLALPTDVSDWVQVQAAVRHIESEWGPIDIWVNNAMVTIFGPVSQLDPADLKRATEVTYLGTAFGTMAALQSMKSRGRGVIIQVGSALAYRAIPLQAAYCAAKHASRGFTDALRCELLHEGSAIKVTTVHLSAFNTPQFDWARNLTGRRAQPVPPIFQPELAARAIVWAARHDQRELFVGWPAVKAVLANKIAPAFLDRYLSTRGYRGQLTDDALPASRCENLFHPCDGDTGSHGRFDRISRSFSMQWWVRSHRRPIFILLATFILLLCAFLAIF